MMSMRLWRMIVRADRQDPLFRRFSEIDLPRPTSAAGRAPWRTGQLALCAAVGATLAFWLSPKLIVLVLIPPIVGITLMVLLPLLLPLLVLAYGFPLTAAVVAGIHREKRRYTYDLLCATPGGALPASWNCAVGYLYRRSWFLPLRWGARSTMTLGIALVCGLGGLSLLLALQGQQPWGWAQLRLLLGLLLLLALYFSTIAQSLVQSLLVGLLASSFSWARADAALAGLLLQALLTALPLLLAALALPLLDEWALLLLMALREAVIMLLWRALRGRLAWGQ